MKTAIVIGATGVTGRPLTRYLLKGDSYDRVIAFSRKPMEIEHGKLDNPLVDFSAMDDWAQEIRGDDIFSALGTTLKQAGSKAAQYEVDYHYQANACRAAADNGVKRLFLVSSPSADARSPIFYTRMKGELDDFVATLGFETLVYFKPSIIEGDRPEGRVGEKVGGAVARFAAAWIPGMSRYRPISGEELARAICNCATRPLMNGVHTFELAQIFELLSPLPVD